MLPGITRSPPAATSKTGSTWQWRAHRHGVGRLTELFHAQHLRLRGTTVLGRASSLLRSPPVLDHPFATSRATSRAHPAPDWRTFRTACHGWHGAPELCRIRTQAHNRGHHPADIIDEILTIRLPCAYIVSHIMRRRRSISPNGNLPKQVHVEGICSCPATLQRCSRRA